MRSPLPLPLGVSSCTQRRDPTTGQVTNIEPWFRIEFSNGVEFAGRVRDLLSVFHRWPDLFPGEHPFGERPDLNPVTGNDLKEPSRLILPS